MFRRLAYSKFLTLVSRNILLLLHSRKGYDVVEAFTVKAVTLKSQSRRPLLRSMVIEWRIMADNRYLCGAGESQLLLVNHEDETLRHLATTSLVLDPLLGYDSSVWKIKSTKVSWFTPLI